MIVQWTAKAGDHWIAPLHVHYEDDEAWYVLRGTPHTWRNAGDVEAEYLLVMPPRIASLIEAIHQPAADVHALFTAHALEISGEVPHAWTSVPQ